MEDNLKAGDEVVLKSNPKKHYVIAEIDIDKINANCVDSEGKKVMLPLISLQKKGFSGFVNIYGNDN